MENAGPHLILALGNPGAAYEGTRHNAGFRVVDEIAARHQLRFRRKWRISSRYCRHHYRGRDVIYVKPRTFMNRSGLAALSAIQTFGIREQQFMVVLDDVHLPLGSLRLRRGGSDGGHNGLASVIGALGTREFPRCRIGIGGSTSEDLAEYVLDTFTQEEEQILSGVLPAAADAVLMFVEKGIGAAMNAFNAGMRAEDTDSG
jgi:PTH1 family peptidyl-tRNA hydrolase